jgi:hypothetical protein
MNPVGFVFPVEHALISGERNGITFIIKLDDNAYSFSG